MTTLAPLILIFAAALSALLLFGKVDAQQQQQREPDDGPTSWWPGGPPRGAVGDLTPALVTELASRRVPMYLVRLDACLEGSDTGLCLKMEEMLWTPLAGMSTSRPSTDVPFFRLDCNSQRKLCSELVSPGHVQWLYEVDRSFDVLTVAYSETKPHKRLVEIYLGKSSDEGIARYLMEMTQRGDPFEPKLPKEIVLPPSAKKEKVDLAVLVLTVDGFVRPDVWQAFLRSQTEEATVRMFVHNKISAEAVQEKKFHVARQVEDAIHVPIVFTSRGSISLTRAVLQLLRHAIAYGGATHYVVVSGDSVPLYSAPDVFRELSRTEGASRFEPHAQSFRIHQYLSLMKRQYDHTRLVMNRYEYMGQAAGWARKTSEEEGDSDDDGDASLFKSKLWASLNATGAEFFADPQNDHTYNFEAVVTGDEYYWTNVATEHGVPFTTLPVMYDEWPEEQAKRPFTLRGVDTTVDGDKFRAGGHLFARKITEDTELRLGWMDDAAGGGGGVAGNSFGADGDAACES